MSASWAGGSTRRYRRIRAFVIERDRGVCRAHADGWCARVGGHRAHVCTGRASAAHHTLGRAVTGDDPRWMVGSCRACNLFIGDPQKTYKNPQNVSVTKW